MGIKIDILVSGYCTQLEKIVIRGGRLKHIKFPSMVVLLRHPVYGYILFDTGYASHFFTETKKFPYWIYSKITPVYLNENEAVKKQLQKMGVKAEEIQYIILSHFHADHIAGCKDFPNAKFICSKVAYEKVKSKRGICALKEAFIPRLLPNDFEERGIYFEEMKKDSFPLTDTSFEEAIDLFGDKSIYAVHLEGHTKGHYGIFTKDHKEKDYFFVGDACWSDKAYEENLLPHWIANLVNKDQKNYKATIKNISLLYKRHPKINIIPSHCLSTIQKNLKTKDISS
ncbi:MBL fold metallo-hydrolase [Crassaminicella profunda]|uniref:MBL fold metallo-hydrolase n=1 Tax=Crassaminicella profunda TaxID=1286698 RepID=UPI001CA70698|nr:MBL fold metallo-hydrolase [Crassaminicella profunda]QZY54022.1 MBL fold metallo-hydrolase [Crassaminicella profunda]